MTLLRWVPPPFPDETNTEAEGPSLCARCQEIPFLDYFNSKKWHFDHSSAQDILSSARNGCRPCSLIEMGLKLKTVVEDEGDVATQCVSMHRTKGDEYNPHQVEFKLGGQPRSGSRNMGLKQVPQTEPKDMWVVYPSVHPSESGTYS
jgi:hypothetical protein